MFMINFHKVVEESDYVAYVSRLRKFRTAFDQLLERGRASSANDIRPPKFAYEGVIDQSRKVISGAPFDDGKDSALWADAQAKADALAKDGKITAERAAELKEDARKALLEVVKPAYERVIAFAERSEEHTSELQSLMRISYAVFCLKKKKDPHSANHQVKHKSPLKHDILDIINIPNTI